jgi:hypothetical protein
MLAALAYYILVRTLASLHGPDSEHAIALGNDYKGKASLALYVIAILLSPLFPIASIGVYLLVVIVWIVPDPRFERQVL